MNSSIPSSSSPSPLTLPLPISVPLTSSQSFSKGTSITPDIINANHNSPSPSSSPPPSSPSSPSTPLLSSPLSQFLLYSLPLLFPSSRHSPLSLLHHFTFATGIIHISQLLSVTEEQFHKVRVLLLAPSSSYSAAYSESTRTHRDINIAYNTIIQLQSLYLSSPHVSHCTLSSALSYLSSSSFSSTSSPAIFPSYTFPSLDNDILQGGLHVGDLIELCGPSASGKTQFCCHFSLSINESFNVKSLGLTPLSKPADSMENEEIRRNNLEIITNRATTDLHHIIYIESTQSSTIQRFRDLVMRNKQITDAYDGTVGSENSNVDPIDHSTSHVSSMEIRSIRTLKMSHIHSLKLYSLYEFIDFLHSLLLTLSTNQLSLSPYPNLKFVIVDSLAVLISPHLTQRKRIHQLMNTAMRLMKFIGSNYHIGFIITNYTIQQGGGGERERAKSGEERERVDGESQGPMAFSASLPSFPFDSSLRPSMGESFSYYSDIRLMFSPYSELQNGEKIIKIQVGKSHRGRVNAFCYAKLNHKGIGSGSGNGEKDNQKVNGKRGNHEVCGMGMFPLTEGMDIPCLLPKRLKGKCIVRDSDFDTEMETETEKTLSQSHQMERKREEHPSSSSSSSSSPSSSSSRLSSVHDMSMSMSESENVDELFRLPPPRN